MKNAAEIHRLREDNFISSLEWKFHRQEEAEEEMVALHPHNLLLLAYY